MNLSETEHSMDCPKCGTDVYGLNLCSRCKTNIKKILEIQQMLNSAYYKAVYVEQAPKSDMIMGMLPPKLINSAIELAERYQNKHSDNTEKQINSLIRWQIAKSAALGFATGLWGLIPGFLGFAIGLLSTAGFFGFIIRFLGKITNRDLETFLDVQTRMATAIAYMRGHNLETDEVEGLVNTCMAGNDAIKVLKKVVIYIGENTDVLKDIAKKLLPLIPPKATAVVSWFAACELSKGTKKKAIANFSKKVPLFGALAGGIIDGICTKRIANAAKMCFCPKGGEEQQSITGGSL